MAFEINTSKLYFINAWQKSASQRLSNNESQPFLCHTGLWIFLVPLLLAWLCNYTRYEILDEITYPFPNFNGAAVEVWEWISNFIPHFMKRVMLRLKLNHVSKRGPWWKLNRWWRMIVIKVHTFLSLFTLLTVRKGQSAVRFCPEAIMATL